MGNAVDVQQENQERLLKRVYRAAVHGDLEAQNTLGMMYFKGDVVKQCYESATRWFTLAAEKNHIQSILNLSCLYYKGLGVSQDLQMTYDLINHAYLLFPELDEEQHGEVLKETLLWFKGVNENPEEKKKYLIENESENVDIEAERPRRRINLLPPNEPQSFSPHSVL
eukprot:TRINITY_DN6682_c0_g1_i1.p1 TRINITY_DN6682_c0_g1~~TRINITY_DN6682_c0_g1_i1.p1  ORF type:complete len:185 (-),score=30.64 TRINITY_DN6682_c0_g1_i1:52-555(-)